MLKHRATFRYLQWWVFLIPHMQFTWCFSPVAHFISASFILVFVRAARWVTDCSGGVEGKLVTDYWLDEPYVDNWRFSCFAPDTEPFAIMYFPYRMEDYITDRCINF